MHRGAGFRLWALAPLLITVTGCGGCGTAKPPQKKDEIKSLEQLAKERAKPDFEPLKLSLLPHADGGPINPAKPGHWVSGALRACANRSDFKGELTTTTVSGSGVMIPLERSPFRLTVTRPVSLPKGQPKLLDVACYIPRPEDTQVALAVQNQLLLPDGGGEIQREPSFTTKLLPHQYFVVVLTQSSDRWGYLRKLASVRPPRPDWTAPADHVVILPKKDQWPLSTNPLMWSTVSYLVWDDALPGGLGEAQQRALLDWLHWGGQLIVNGTRGLDALRNSFLHDYLPATAGETQTLTSDQMDALDRFWLQPLVGKLVAPKSVEVGKEYYPNYLRTAAEPAEGSAGQAESDQDRDATPLVPLTLRDDGHFVAGTENLVAERRVGRGRIAVTAMSLTSPRFVRWSGFDGFWHVGVLRRPRRMFEVNAEEFVADTQYLDSGHRYDPRASTAVRYFSRDAGAMDPAMSQHLDESDSARAILGPNPVGLQQASQADQPALPMATGRPQLPEGHVPSGRGEELFERSGYQSDSRSGVGGWNDFSAAARAARSALQRAAGVAVPNARFVLSILAGYLVVLVPVNWLFFRLLGRMEWAWIAAPIIALGGAAAVIYFAQLDIGFVRSRTEVALVEVQGTHPRAHVTRYCGFYTSLSSNYQLVSESADTLVQPFSLDPAGDRLQQQTLETVRLRRGIRNELDGYPIISNSTGMLHAEQMMDLPGQVTFRGAGADGTLNNATDFVLQDVALVTRDTTGRVLTGTLDTLAAGQSMAIALQPDHGLDAVHEIWERSATTRADSALGDLNVRQLLDLAIDPASLRAGDQRLVAWSDQEVPGIHVVPAARQNVFRTVVVVHLRRGRMSDPLPDVNTAEEARHLAKQALPTETTEETPDEATP